MINIIEYCENQFFLSHRDDNGARFALAQTDEPVVYSIISLNYQICLQVGGILLHSNTDTLP